MTDPQKQAVLTAAREVLNRIDGGMIEADDLGIAEDDLRDGIL